MTSTSDPITAGTGITVIAAGTAGVAIIITACS
jgi:hypothetical protein